MVTGKPATYGGIRTIEAHDSEAILAARLYLMKARGDSEWSLRWREYILTPGHEWPTMAEATIASGLTLRQAKKQAAELFARGRAFPYPEWKLYSPYTWRELTLRAMALTL